MKTPEELQRELFNQTSEVEQVLLKLDKASMLLGHWMNEYTFREMPNPALALKNWTAICPQEKEQEEQSVKWFYNYSQIVGFIDIIADYVYESRKALEKVVDKESA